MAKSDYVYESGTAVDVGTHGEHSYVFASGEPFTDSGVSTYVFESGTGIRGGTGDGVKTWVGISQSPAVVAELDASLSVVQQRTISGIDGDGVGGGGNIVWLNNRTEVYELAPSDLSTVRIEGYSDSNSPTEGGGKENELFTASGGVTERSPTDAEIIRTASPSNSGNASGGDSTDVYVSDTSSASELSYSDFSVVDTWAEGSVGMGGNVNFLVQGREEQDSVVQERDPDDKSLLQENDTGGDIIHGAGGSK